MSIGNFKNIITLTLVFQWCLVGKTNPQNLNSHIKKKHKEIVQRWGQSVSNQDFNKMSEIISEDYIWHFPGRDIIGWNNMKKSFERLFKGFPDIQLIPEDIISDGEKVIVRWIIKGTHRGEFLGVKPTHRSVTYSSISIDQVLDNKFIEGWEIYDELGLRKQLGFDVTIHADSISKDSASRQKLVQTRIELRQALLDNDIEILERLYAKDYVLTTRSGKILTKPQRIASIKSGQLRYLKFAEESDIQIRMYGNTAVVTGVGATITRLDGNEVVSGKKRFTEVFIHQDGLWRMVARHASTVK